MVAATLLASESAVVTELPMAPSAYGIIAFASLVALLLVTYAFRSVGKRH